MKRLYWFAGCAVVLVGVWWVGSRNGGPEPNRAASKPIGEPGLERRTTSGDTSRPPNVQNVVRVESQAPRDNELHASVVPRPADVAVTPAVEDSEELSVLEEVTLLRKPVIDAIRLLGVSKADKFEKMREALRDSGDSAEPWTRKAPEAFGDWSRLLDGKGGASLDEGSARCYLAGCEALVYFGSEADYELAASAFRGLSDDNAAHGGRVQTPPKQMADGRWVAAWLMMRPNVGVE